MNPFAMFFTMLTVYAVLNLAYGIFMFYRERREQRKCVRTSTTGTTTYVEFHPKVNDK